VQEDENAIESDEAERARARARERERERERGEPASLLAARLRLAPFRSFCLGAVNIVRSA
jgi:hypothetical protein